MSRGILGFGAALAALLFLPPALQAQAPVVLVCNDGTTQPGSSRAACQGNGGMDWDATRAWSEMRAGHFAATDTVVCIDGQAAAAGPRACGGHGGVDSVSTLAAVKRRAKAHRYAAKDSSSAQGYQGAATGVDSTAGRQQSAERGCPSDGSGDCTAPRDRGKGRDQTKSTSAKPRSDSTKWGYPVDRDPEVQNPAGYRGMERPTNVFPPDSGTSGDSAAPADATSRVNQMRRQDSLDSDPHQNPPGYRGMERPASLDSASAGANGRAADSASGDSSSGDSSSTVRAGEGSTADSAGFAR